MVIGTKFNIILYSDILNKIAEATNSLYYDVYCEPVEIAEEIVNDKLKEMKDLVNCYIDQQLTTFKNFRYFS